MAMPVEGPLGGPPVGPVYLEILDWIGANQLQAASFMRSCRHFAVAFAFDGNCRTLESQSLQFGLQLACSAWFPASHVGGPNRLHNSTTRILQAYLTAVAVPSKRFRQ